MGRKRSVRGVRHLFLLSFQVDPTEEAGSKEESMCPCHSALAGWTESLPEEVQQKRRLLLWQQPRLLGTRCTTGWGGWQRPGLCRSQRILRKPESPKEAVSTNRNVSLPALPLWPSWQGIFLWALQTREQSLCQASSTGQVSTAQPVQPCQHAKDGSPLLACLLMRPRAPIGSTGLCRSLTPAGFLPETGPGVFCLPTPRDTWPRGRPSWRKQLCIPRSSKWTCAHCLLTALRLPPVRFKRLCSSVPILPSPASPAARHTHKRLCLSIYVHGFIFPLPPLSQRGSQFPFNLSKPRRPPQHPA